jgi:hypothetical protein
MDNLIQQLSNRAKEYARDYILDAKQYGYYTEENEFEIRFEKKFAELIIRECAGLPFRNTAHVTTDGEIAVSDVILEHFGIE